jgi:hypothetical protein
MNSFLWSRCCPKNLLLFLFDQGFQHCFYQQRKKEQGKVGKLWEIAEDGK